MNFMVSVSTRFKEEKMDVAVEMIKETLREIAGEEDGLCVGLTYCNMSWDVFSKEAAENLATRFRLECEGYDIDFDVEILDQ